jgi:hypothetical protein
MGTSSQPPQNGSAVSSNTLRRRSSKADLGGHYYSSGGAPTKGRLVSTAPHGDKSVSSMKIAKRNNQALIFYTNGDFQHASDVVQQAASL